jgi:hypothetical protein
MAAIPFLFPDVDLRLSFAFSPHHASVTLTYYSLEPVPKKAKFSGVDA